jgi:hypothetical protein
MAYVCCPKCHQHIIMIADEFKPVEERIIVEEENGEEKKETE